MPVLPTILFGTRLPDPPRARRVEPDEWTPTPAQVCARMLPRIPWRPSLEVLAATFEVQRAAARDDERQREHEAKVAARKALFKGTITPVLKPASLSADELRRAW